MNPMSGAGPNAEICLRLERNVCCSFCRLRLVPDIDPVTKPAIFASSSSSFCFSLFSRCCFRYALDDKLCFCFSFIPVAAKYISSLRFCSSGKPLVPSVRTSSTALWKSNTFLGSVSLSMKSLLCDFLIFDFRDGSCGKSEAGHCTILTGARSRFFLGKTAEDGIKADKGRLGSSSLTLSFVTRVDVFFLFLPIFREPELD